MRSIVCIVALLFLFLVIGKVINGCNSNTKHKREMEAATTKYKSDREEIEKVRADSDQKVKEYQDNADKRIADSYKDANQLADGRIAQILKEERAKYDIFILKSQEAERNRFDAMLTDVRREKYSTYALFIGGMLLFLAIFFNLVFALTPLNIKMLLFPSRYEVVSKEEAELVRFLKSYIISKRKLSPDHLLTKDDCIDLITKN